MRAYSMKLEGLSEPCWKVSRRLTCSPNTDPVTMRVQQPKMGIRRTLYGQTTLTGADRSQAPPSGGKASRWSLDSGSGQGARHQRGYVPPLEKPIQWDEHLGGQAAQGAGERECPPEEVGRREGAGHRHPNGGESGKLLSIRPGGGLPSSVFVGTLGSPSVGLAG